MNELKTNSKKPKAKIITVPEIISISISLIAVMVSLLIFFLPLVKNHFTIEDPAGVCIYAHQKIQIMMNWLFQLSVVIMEIL